MDINRLRLNGFASGMDIDEMVGKLMKAHRIPLDKIKQNKQLDEWKRDDYRSMNLKILDIRNEAFKMKLQGTYQAKVATSNEESVVTVTGSNNATEGNYTIKINSLAAAASVTSADVVPVTIGGGAGNSALTLGGAGGLGLAGDTTLSIGGEKGTATILVKTTDSLDQLVKNINGKSNITGVKVSYDSTLDRLFFVSTNTGANAKIDLKSTDPTLLDDVLKLTTASAANGNLVTGTKGFTGGSTEIIDSTLTSTGKKLTIGYDGDNYVLTVYKDTTIGQLINDINNSLLGQTGVSAYLDGTGKLAFFNPDDSKTLTFSDDNSGNLVDDLGLTAPSDVTGQTYEKLNAVATGTNASVTFNGDVTGSYSSNTFTIAGLTFAAKKAQDVLDPAVNITVNQDVDTVFNNIKSFVDKYNELTANINSELSEERYRDYFPLTDEQKEDMKDTDIERWEDRAKSGLLRRDNLLSSALTKFRTALSSVVEGLPSGDLKHLSDIGITTGEYSEKGKLYIDEAKLREAISSKPDEVMALFTTNDEIDDSDSGDGLALRLYELADDTYESIINKAGSASSSALDSYTIGKTLKNYDKQITKLDVRLQDLEDRYYRQFTAMERALNQMNAQSAYLAQQFGG